MKLIDPALAEPCVRSAWSEQVRRADQHNDPGNFTALIADGIDMEYAKARARWEPLVEVTQTKGDSETHAYLSPDVGSTVDVEKATYTNTIGDAQLSAVWSDPGFDPKQRAFYYARVLEISTPRWTTYETARFRSRVAADVPRTLQERAYTSPIWYTP